MKPAHTWNYDINEGENLFHKSIQQSKSVPPLYKNEWKIN
jgi:hypothetical protein